MNRAQVLSIVDSWNYEPKRANISRRFISPMDGYAFIAQEGYTFCVWITFFSGLYGEAVHATRLKTFVVGPDGSVRRSGSHLFKQVKSEEELEQIAFEWFHRIGMQIVLRNSGTDMDYETALSRSSTPPVPE